MIGVDKIDGIRRGGGSLVFYFIYFYTETSFLLSYFTASDNVFSLSRTGAVIDFSLISIKGSLFLEGWGFYYVFGCIALRLIS